MEESSPSTGSPLEQERNDPGSSLDSFSADIETWTPNVPRRDISQIYQPLNESQKQIRVLRLFPFCQPDGLVHCLLETRSLLDLYKYNAVSYAWGTHTETTEIVCNHTIVRVPKSLESVLRNLRLKLTTADVQLELWIDALCINQQDLAEKSSQVLIMDQIYRQAINTIVWLGAEENDSSFAIKVIERMGESTELKSKKPETWREFPELFDLRFWTALDRLFDRSFWTRLWVLQEIAVSRGIVIICGKDELSWHLLESAHSFWDDISWDRPWRHFDSEVVSNITANTYARLNIFQSARNGASRNSRGGDPILVHLNVSLHLQCYDPRDKIYGLLGISSDDVDIIPDYSLAVRTVYTELLAEKLKDGGNIVTLLLSGSGIFWPEDRTCDLPSWVCDWMAWSKSTPLCPILYSPIFFYQRHCYKTSGSSEPSIRTTPGSDSLHTKAIFCQKVATTRIRFDRRPGFWKKLLKPRDVESSMDMPLLQAGFRTVMLDTDRKDMQRLGVDRDLLATLIVGFFIDIYLMTVEKEQREHILVTGNIDCLEAFRLFAEPDHVSDAELNVKLAQEFFLGEQWKDLDLKAVQERESIRACYHLYRDRAAFNVGNHAFFFTDQGFVGLGPVLLEKGDDICVLPGLSVPFVMCKRDTAYEMIGPCFVIGLMDGEAMELLGLGEFEIRDITIQ